jgi:hypothetical protein
MPLGFRGPASIRELLKMEESARAFRAAGRLDSAFQVEDALRNAMRSSNFDGPSMGVHRALRSMESERMPDMQLAPQSLEGLDVPGLRALEDLGPEIASSVRSYEGLRKAGGPGPRGGTANLPNQPHAKAAGLEIRAAAEESIQSMREAQMAEAMARRAAGAAAVGGGLMIGDTLTGGASSRQPTTANMPMELEQASDPMVEEYAPETAAPPELSEFMAPDVELLPVEDAPVTNDYMSMALPTDLMSDDPMATADLAMESRPLPESTPRVAMTGAQAAEEIMADARAQMERLNSYRRSGQITPQVDRQMTQEIQRMMQLVNEARSGR